MSNIISSEYDRYLNSDLVNFINDDHSYYEWCSVCGGNVKVGSCSHGNIFVVHCNVGVFPHNPHILSHGGAWTVSCPISEIENIFWGNGSIYSEDQQRDFMSRNGWNFAGYVPDSNDEVGVFYKF